MNHSQKDNRLLRQFCNEFNPLEDAEYLRILTDKRTEARFCECHIKGSTLTQLGTTDAPLDPEEQMEYKANRDLRENHPAFQRMQSDAKQGRSFSNIVAEYTKQFGKSHPLKIGSTGSRQYRMRSQMGSTSIMGLRFTSD